MLAASMLSDNEFVSRCKHDCTDHFKSATFSSSTFSMNHFTTPDFWEHYNTLPKEVQELADKNYGLLRSIPMHPSLHFKRLKDVVWSVGISRQYRALTFEHEDGYDWFWIGSHTDYDQLMKRL